jgi:hypothetical protein
MRALPLTARFVALVLLMQTRRVGGLAHTDVTAVALMPCGRPWSSLQEMMLTVVANLRIASRNASSGRSVSSASAGCSKLMRRKLFTALLR